MSETSKDIIHTEIQSGKSRDPQSHWNFQHGHASGGELSLTYKSWSSMKRRCYDKGCDSYPSYGGKGITVHQNWIDSYECFLRDMGERPTAKHSIDRFPNKKGNYEPGNCRWATKKQQDRNRKSNILVTRDGVTKCVKDWCDELGLNVDQVYGRIRWGKTPEEALR